MRGYAAIALERCKCKENLGGALRAAGCYGASMLVISGGRLGKYSTDTMRQYKHMPAIETDDIMSVTPYGSTPVVVELSDRAKCLTNFKHPESAYYIFGPEDGSVSDDIIDQCKHVVSVPTSHCMNLAATVNVVLYDRAAKQIIVKN